MKCPNCEETLLMTVRNQVEIDYCPKCRGIWLDRGELDKIIDQSDNQYSDNRSAGPARPDRYSDSHDYRDQYPKNRPYKKKKSFLGDLFDFD